MPQLPKPPGVVISAGVLLIIYAALMLFAGVCGGLLLALDDPNEALLEEEAPGYHIVQVFSTVSNVVMGVILVVIGVSFFQLMPLARSAGYVACTYEIVAGIGLFFYNLILVMPAAERLLALQAQNGPGIEMFTRTFMWGSVIFGILLPLAFCAPVIYLLSLPAARSAFAGDFQGAPPSAERRRRYEDFDDEDDNYPPPQPSDTGIQGPPS